MKINKGHAAGEASDDIGGPFFQGRSDQSPRRARNQLTTLVSIMAEKLGVSTPIQRDLAEIQQDVVPEAVLEEIERQASQ